MIRPLIAAAAISTVLMSGPAVASDDLAAELKRIANAQKGPFSQQLASISYDDAVDLLDALNHVHYRLLSQAMTEGHLDMPTSIRQALELKAPRLDQRGAGR